jgi:hypothetical protein
MNRARRFAIAVAALVLAAPAWAGGMFVAGVEDIPLMAGLTEAPQLTLVFDAPSGRVVEAYAEGRVDRQTVSAYYARTLPELGWQHVGTDRFRREGESLVIDYPGGQTAIRLVVRFFLSPG